MGKLLAIYVCPDKGRDMCDVQEIQVMAGAGLAGDRYALGKGAYSNSKRIAIRHVSLIGIEAITEANKSLSIPFLPQETRRNLLTEGIDPNDLIGKAFRVGQVVMLGAELCDPCTRPSVLANKPGFEAAFQQRGGLRAEILTDGVICVGDDISIMD